jgi:hypothetical protein
MFFIYWGFVYGIGMFFHAVAWFIGIYLFQLSAPRLLKFAVSEDTLHGFMEKEYDASRAIRRITAACTLLGFTGSLLIEVSLTTDVLASLGYSVKAGATWIVVFTLLLVMGWLYVTYGGYKSAVLAYAVQLPVVYATLCAVFCYMLWLNFHAGYFRQAVLTGLCFIALWLIVLLARTGARIRRSHLDNAGRIALASVAATLLLIMVFGWIYRGTPAAQQGITDSPDSFTWTSLRTQNWVVLLGFGLLSLATQFCDFTAWQRISSLKLQGTVAEQIRGIRHAIGETKWESPATWGFGIICGVALRHTGLFHNTKEAMDAMTSFITYLAHDPGAGFVGRIIILPCLAVGFVSIMLSTVDALLAGAIYTWIVDISVKPVPSFPAPTEADRGLIRSARLGSFAILFIAAVIFVVLHRGFHLDVFLALNTVASAQLVITFLSVGALFLGSPKEFRQIAIATATVALITDLAVTWYCYDHMTREHSKAFADWTYALPTLGSTAGALITFGLLTLLSGTKIRKSSQAVSS